MSWDPTAVAAGVKGSQCHRLSMTSKTTPCCLAGLNIQLSTPQIVKWPLHVQRKRTCEHPGWLARRIADRLWSLYLDRMRRFTSILAHIADLGNHTEITLQVVPRLKYELSLLVDNEEKELRKISDETWEPAKPLYAPCFFHTCTCWSLCLCRDVSPTAQMGIEIQLNRSHLPWGKKERGSNEIDCQALFKDYWSTTSHEFLVRGQLESPSSPFITDQEGAANIVVGKHSYLMELQFSAEVTVRLLAVAHRRLLTFSHRRILYGPHSKISRDC